MTYAGNGLVCLDLVVSIRNWPGKFKELTVNLPSARLQSTAVHASASRAHYDMHDRYFCPQFSRDLHSKWFERTRGECCDKRPRRVLKGRLCLSRRAPACRLHFVFPTPEKSNSNAMEAEHASLRNASSTGRLRKITGLRKEVALWLQNERKGN